MLIGVANCIPFAVEALRLRPNAKANLRVSIRVCKDCGFVGPSQVYPFHQLVGLYKDYRSDAYNRDRCSVEPSYRDIMDAVGKSQQEIASRIQNIDAIVERLVPLASIDTVLDWGGGEGRFIPSSLRQKSVTILDYSTEEPVDPAYVRLEKLDPSQQYDYIQICHVLEHVSEPRSLMEEVVSHLKPGGYIYVELPQDKSEQELGLFASSPTKAMHSIHEHLNLYSQKALHGLATSLGLRCLHLASRDLDFGWANAMIISGLFVKDL
jgi:hypothetical protein